MELLVLDKNFNDLGTIELFSSLQWIRRYYSVGEFELHCSKVHFSLIEEGVYLYRKNEEELALIEKYDLKNTEVGDSELIASGMFIETILNDRVLPGKQTTSGTHETIARTLVTNNLIAPTSAARKFNNLLLGTNGNKGTQHTLSTENEYLGDTLYDLLKQQELSQKISYDYLTNKLYYSVWSGLDRTDTQQVNSQAVFSDNLENIIDDEYSKDYKDYKNFCYVVGKTRTIEVDKVSNDFRRKELVISMYDDDTNKLTAEGNMQLGKNKIVEVFDGQITTNLNFKYKIDYDLGDLCTFIKTDIGKVANKRITEIKEVYENGNVEIYPKFGDDYITLNQKIKREVKR